MGYIALTPTPISFDAIVVGSGISGGWAAMELCKKGLKTLLLERGRDLIHIKDYPTAMKHPWEFPFRLRNTQDQALEYPVQSTCYAFNSATESLFVKDTEHPYIQEQPFSWIRGYQMGGRSLTWGRQCYRWNERDFMANLHDGHGVDWPIRYADLEPWYTYVEDYVGVSGKKEGRAELPDGQFLRPMDMNCLEEHMSRTIAARYNDRFMTIARLAQLTEPHRGRGLCQYRNMCSRGCPYGGYFSSNSATLPDALKTGNLTIRPYSIVSEVLYDPSTNKASGVRVVDAESLEVYDFRGRMIFLNASTLATTQIVLNSTSAAFPTGLGNSSGQLGHHLMDHQSGSGAHGTFHGFEDRYYTGRRPGGIVIPRFQNLTENTQEYLRGFMLQGQAFREGWERFEHRLGSGLDFKRQFSAPGPWVMWLEGWGECLPYVENRVWLDSQKKDRFGQPILVIDCRFRANEDRMKVDIERSATELLDLCGFESIRGFQHPVHPGETIHEMGTARMGRDPRTSVLNGHNQMHEVKNVFITDGACMTSSGSVNPSLTYMALTARACAYAFDELKAGRL